MATINIDAKCDLNKPVVVRHLDGMVFSQDVKANMIRVSVFRNREPVDLSGGSVSANIIRADGATVVQTGTIEGNVCSVVLPSSAYAVPGQIAIFVKHSTSAGPTTSTIAAITGYVYKSTTDTIVDPGSVVPNVNQLLAMIEDCEEATEACIAATAAAPVVDDTAGAGDTNKVWSADKSAGEVQSLMTEINSKADKTVTDALQKNKAPVIIDSAEGNPIVLTDGADGLPVEGMKIHFLPVQDLHGYDSPWPSGGGKNKFNISSFENIVKNGITFLFVNPSMIHISGTATANAFMYSAVGDATFTLPAGDYVMSTNMPSGSSNGWLRLYTIIGGASTNIVDYCRSGSDKTFTLQEETVVAPQVIVATGQTINADVWIQIESGSGSTATDYAPYSNECPISGWSGLAMRRTRKNLLDLTVYNGGSYNPKVGTVFELWKASDAKQFTDNGDGTFSVTTSSTWTAHTLLVPIVYGLPYHTKFGFSSSGTGGITHGYLDKDFTVLESSSSTSATQNINVNNNIPDGASYYFIVISNRSTANTTLTLTEPQTEIGTSATPYEKYVGESYHVTFPDGQTIYGGTPDVVNGVLKVEYRRIVADGTNVKVTGGYGSAGSEWLPAIVLSTADKGVSGYAEGNLYASYLAYNQGSAVQTTENTICMASSGGIIALHIGTMQGTDGSHGYSSADELKTAVNAYLAEHNLEIVYKLATPIEIQLDSLSVQTLLGDNVIWSDANGTIELDYRADTKLFIAKNKQDIRATIAPIEDGATASKAYSAGKLFYHDGNLCKAKTSIASGATFTLNTNYEVTTIADELFALN